MPEIRVSLRPLLAPCKNPIHANRLHPWLKIPFFVNFVPLCKILFPIFRGSSYSAIHSGRIAPTVFIAFGHRNAFKEESPSTGEALFLRDFHWPLEKLSLPSPQRQEPPSSSPPSVTGSAAPGFRRSTLDLGLLPPALDAKFRE